MDKAFPDYISKELQRLDADHHLRTLVTVRPGLVDFTSNDYLGIARKDISSLPLQENQWGSAGSRLLSGNQSAHERLEQESAAFFRGESALLFSSGYLANLALLSALPRRGDTLLMDEFCHASLREGARLSFADVYTFRHNDLAHLEQLISKARGAVFVITEALFSMDGDLPPLIELAALCKKTGAWLILDEAHSTGILGPEGAGLACQLNLQDQVLARIHTFGKAVGRMGAVIVGRAPLIQYLVNKARPFIYSTAMPAGQATLISDALKSLSSMDAERERIVALRKWLNDQLAENHRWTLPPGDSPIVPLIIPGNQEVRRAAAVLQAQGLDVRAVLSPTVPAGSERLRIILHSYNTEEEIKRLFTTLGQLDTPGEI